ncbi:DUF2950 domain-containing protein [Citrobacter amalonaticus]|uniref:DUF2950 domain-containing protein n=1 Tax=Citrobacter amalonaticus TaxID=35703 RepID=A0A2S4RWZ0_CITAM|nr:DUF2950 family protein [Citrobacter amalonaticus]POT55925.1 DUF2950 domain-containing protein [Citrobacter amalonaticus]POT74233.1 DUF2950 domain-containing protein [Citrobacter amalonaticus]POU65034.1 DUF2950 domain-containing protein [Citrobacter amalonaticus]POV03868.1 DUF2950 domain-containing protein [Citrobacter amalonaticus]
MKKLTLFSALALLTLPLLAQAQQQFSTPDRAADALVNAVTTHDEAKLSELLGDNWREYFPPEGADPQAVARFLRDWKISHRIVQQGNMAHLNVGQESWQLPVPLIKTDAGWRFDMAAAEDEILTRAIGRNELAAIEAMHAYIDAQQDYYALNHAYAQKFISSDGKKDGLYWPTAPGEAPSPLGPAFSPAAPGMGYHGYHFRMIANKDEKGFALLAWPVMWGETGIMSFMVNQDDKVYQADLGKETGTKVTEINHFSHNAPWNPVE